MKNIKGKIMHLVCVFPPYKGGIGAAAKKQAEIGAKYGYNVSVYTPFYPKIEDFGAKIAGIDVYHAKPIIFTGNAAFINTKKYIKNCDILHIHYPFYSSIELAILWAKLYHKKILTFWHMNPKAKGIKGLIFRIYEKTVLPWVIKNSDKVLVSTKDYFLEGGFKKIMEKYKNKIEELPFSIDANIFKPAQKDESLVKRYLLKNKNTLIFVGGLDKGHYFKGLEILLSAFSKLDQKKYRLFVVGDGDLRLGYEKMTKDLNIDSNVIFLGDINDKELINYYNLSDALVLPSINRGEAFGIVQIEAMACAKPVIVSDLPGVRKVLENKKTGYTFKVGDSNDLKEKIEKLFENKSNYNKMSENARNRVVEKYIDAFVFQKLNKIYENLLNK